MAATSGRWAGVGAAVAGLAVLAAGAARGQDKDPKDDPLRAELLKLNTAATDDAQAGKLKAMLKDKEKTKKLVAEAARMMKEAKDEKPFNYNGAFILARAAHRILRDHDAAEKFYEHLTELAGKLKSKEKSIQAYAGLLDLYWDAKRYSDVVDTAEKILDMPELDDVQGFAVEQLIRGKAKLGKTDEALALIKGLTELKDVGWYFLQLRGWVLRDAGKTEAAIEAYTEALDKIDADKTLKGEAKDQEKDRVRYTLSGLYVDNKEVDKAAKQLQTLIQRNKDNPRELATYKNDLGFIWCDHDLNLEESEKLIREALDLDRKRQEKLKAEKKIDEVRPTAAYLDSLGWVLFKQKKYKEALEPLKQAAADEDEGGHLEIWDHLADCHLALGQTKDAVAAWEKALKMEDLSRRDKERREKVGEKLRKAKAELAKD